MQARVLLSWGLAITAGTRRMRCQAASALVVVHSPQESEIAMSCIFLFLLVCSPGVDSRCSQQSGGNPRASAFARAFDVEVRKAWEFGAWPFGQE